MTPGTYLRLRREAAGFTRDDLALCLDSTVPVSARSRTELLALIEGDTAVIDAGFVDALTDLYRVGRFRFDRHVLIILIARHAGAEIAAPHVCRSCGCSWNDACEEGCGWASAEQDWCTACAEHAVDAVLAPPVALLAPGTLRSAAA